jgi:hypothetical protein
MNHIESDSCLLPVYLLAIYTTLTQLPSINRRPRGGSFRARAIILYEFRSLNSTLNIISAIFQSRLQFAGLKADIFQ